jgi:DNA repair protein RadC
VWKRLIGHLQICVGSLVGTLVHPREVFAGTIAHKGAAIVLTHKHSSGEPEPSPEDIALTRRLTAAGSLLGIQVLDYIIPGDGTARWVCLKDREVI